MRASFRLEGASGHLEVNLDPEDEVRGLGQWGMPIELTVPSCVVHLPHPVDPHPDLIALAVLAIVRPWIKRRLRLSSAVSSRFAEVVAENYHIEMHPVDPQLQSRQQGTNPILGLSLGPDCLAGDVLLGMPMKAFYFVRTPHGMVPNRATHIRHDVILKRLQEAKHRDWTIDVTHSNLEFMAARPFPTFAHWVTMFVGPILTADADDLGFIVSGRHIGGHYIHSGQGFDLQADHDLEHRAMFEAAGLSLVSAVAGLTEVGTMLLARNHPLFDLSSSCLLSAKPRGGCGRCEKCFRKELALAWVEDRPPRTEVLEWAEADPALRRRFEKFETTPQPHSLAFLACRLPGLNRSFLKEWVGQYPYAEPATCWVDRWYPRGISDWLPQAWQTDALGRLAARMKMMTPDDTQIVDSWPHPLLRSVNLEGGG